MNDPTIKVSTSTAEAVRRRNRDRRIQKPYGRNMRLRGTTFRRIKPPRKSRDAFGKRWIRNSGYAELGHATNYYHSTKGWRHRITPSAATMLGATLAHWMLFRLDLIIATIKGDEEGIEKAKAAFKRSTDL